MSSNTDNAAPVSLGERIRAMPDVEVEFQINKIIAKIHTIRADVCHLRQDEIKFGNIVNALVTEKNRRGAGGQPLQATLQQQQPMLGQQVLAPAPVNLQQSRHAALAIMTASSPPTQPRQAPTAMRTEMPAHDNIKVSGLRLGPAQPTVQQQQPTLGQQVLAPAPVNQQQSHNAARAIAAASGLPTQPRQAPPAMRTEMPGHEITKVSSMHPGPAQPTVQQQQPTPGRQVLTPPSVNPQQGHNAVTITPAASGPSTQPHQAPPAMRTEIPGYNDTKVSGLRPGPAQSETSNPEHVIVLSDDEGDNIQVARTSHRPLQSVLPGSKGTKATVARTFKTQDEQTNPRKRGRSTDDSDSGPISRTKLGRESRDKRASRQAVGLPPLRTKSRFKRRE
ncbi:hypothetical protein LTR15_006522 [Elasticomyces elasticus]|nr:hypothetical protein LTR15_006522 [Elasticomyces elasticus]